MNNVAKTYTVSQVNSFIKEAIENNLPGKFTVTGEIADWKANYQSGHCYFSLKDKKSVLPCVMWKSNFSKIKFQPANGMEILAAGHIDVYPPQGKYQFYADKLIPAGVGELQLAFEQMVEKLQKEGLFDEKHKKALPKVPQRIGILTSESGAALQDIRDSIHNRWRCVKLLLRAVPVQGKGAGRKIALAIQELNRRNKELKLDIIIVARGGGSMEDLWEFNEEVLARAIFNSQIPVISAVGHEIDTTIADLVADARASTPTKAGLIAVPDEEEILEKLRAVQNRLQTQAMVKLKISKQQLQTILASAVFTKPEGPVYMATQQVDEISQRLLGLAKNMIADAINKLHKAYENVIKIEPHKLLGKKNIELNNLNSRSQAAIITIINRSQLLLSAQANRLKSLNPKSVLSRGYSITINKRTETVVTKPEDIKIGDVMVTELAGKNLIESEVQKKLSGKKTN